ncbi:UDP-glucuronosyltransferase 2B33-like isoform X2 [Amphiura filiformis]|uniref:UDP-glucuronosyltransferase 2B33-like isoform X2 n=1 Tax=Amphiura filiformis TaxID=82378 RepID=UPI003B221DA0
MTSRFYVSFVLFALLTVALVSGSMILFHPWHGEGSHYYVQKSIAMELIKRGHNITFLVDNKFEEPIKLDGQKEGFSVEVFHSPIELSEYNIVMHNTNKTGLRGKYFEFATELLQTDYMQRQATECSNLLSDEKVVSNLKHFDLAIEDPMSTCPFVQYLKIPYVMVAPVMFLPCLTSLEGRFPFYPSYMPEFATALDHKMSFMERLKNTAFVILFTYYIRSGVLYSYNEILEKYYMGDKSLLQVLYADAEMWLINTDFVLDFPRPVLPNTALVGGLTAAQGKPLSSDWEDFLQSAGDDGVVLFSMGSYATGIDEDIAALFAGAFAQLPQKVIWKLNGKPSSTLTANVKVVDWIPQNDLLAHPQIKVFVYHCGLNGIWEAVYHGVPMVAIPLFGDQFDNAQRLVSRGMGVKVDIATLTSDELAEAIRTVINNPSYKDNATRISSIFRDRSRTPAEEAADWLEYVIRHGGAKHLRSAALDLNIFQYFLLDVMAVLLVAFLTVFAILICCCRLCFRGCRKVCGRTTKAKSE